MADRIAKPTNRRLTRIREGVCCTDEVSVCSQSATTYTLLEASGPDGTISFVFADGVAFLEERGWAHEEYDDVTGTVDLALDLCGLPQPRG